MMLGESLQHSFQHMESSLRNIFYQEDGDFTPLLRRKVQVGVHDDGVTYKGAISDIIVDKKREVWIQCHFDKAKDKRVCYRNSVVHLFYCGGDYYARCSGSIGPMCPRRWKTFPSCLTWILPF